MTDRDVFMRDYLAAVRRAAEAVHEARVMGVRLGLRGECAREAAAAAEAWERTAVAQSEGRCG